MEEAVRVLLVEDDEDDYVLISRLLSKVTGQSYLIHRAENYEEALASVKASSFDVCLLDYRLGERTGLELLEEFTRRGVAFPIVFLTGQGDHAVDMQAMRAGATDYLAKDQLGLALLERSIRYSIRNKGVEALLEERVRQRTAQLERSNAYLLEEARLRRQGEEELRASEERFRLLYEHAPLGYQSLDEQGRFLEVNQAWLEATGYVRAEIIGRHFGEVMTPASAENMHAHFARFRDEGNIHGVEFEMIRRDGSTFLASFDGKIGYGRDGRFKQTHCLMTDITERRRAEQALREREEIYRGMFLNSHAVMLLVDPSTGCIVEANPAACVYYGHDSEAFRRLRIPDLNVLSEEETLIQMELARTSGSIRFAFQHRLASGEVRDVEVMSGPVLVGGREVLYSIVIDVTERTRLEEALKQARDAADAANRAKSEFLANMSHEIRTPMNGVLGMTELALSTVTDVRTKEYLGYIKQSGRALLGIINDILDFSRIEAGKLHLETAEFDPCQVVEEALKPLAITAREKGLVLRWAVDPDIPDRLMGDAGRLRQVLINLASNAIKFTEQGRIVVRVDPHRPTSGENAPPEDVWLRFEVRDTGLGIPLDKQDKLFQSFSQVNGSVSRRHGGAGLGLAICKQLAEMMGGRIWLESAPGEGSAFTFTVRLTPVRETAIERHARRELAAEDKEGLSILVAEDNQVNQILARQLLEQRGHRVEMAANGREALEKLKKQRFDCVLMDMRMPEMGGEEAAGVIRSGTIEGVDPAIPIIALTALAMKEDRERFLAAGMDSYVSKPIMVEELERVLRGVCRRRARLQ